MIVTCSNCSSSLQIDETKATTQRFTIRCPKCQNTIPVQIGSTPNAVQNWAQPSAATFQKQQQTAQTDSVADSLNSADLIKMLAAALQSNDAPKPNTPEQQRRVLVCLSAERSQTTAPLLDEAGYHVFIAENPAQATEKIRDAEVDIIVFSPDFASKFSGASVMQQMISGLPINQRRKFFVVAIEESSQTFDTHEAFMRNLNLIINSRDLNHLPSILHRALRDFNELYRYFNQAAQPA